MTTKSATSKHKNAPAKSAGAVSKSVTANPAATRLAPAQEATAAKAGKKNKKAGKASGKTGNKVKLVRDSFTMPQSDYAKIGELKQACLTAGMQVKKSELLRAGLHALAKLSMPQLQQAIARMEPIKAVRLLKKTKASPD